ncbi:MAG: GFA family protein [Dongiaceae bacterium]
MARITGIGGIFFKSRDPDRLRAWYREHLGIESQPGNGAIFPWRPVDRLTETGYTVWSPFPHDTRYFEPGTASFMINYRVDDLDALLARLRAKGAAIDGKIEHHDQGRFAWVIDPDGNRVELWEPAKPPATAQVTPSIPADGGCLCGAVRFRATGLPLRAGYCHCRLCQLNSGAPVSAWVEIAIEDFAVIKGTPGIYQSSDWGERLFCPTCGSFLLFRGRPEPKSVSVNAASFDDPAQFPPTHHIFVSRRIPWFDTADSLPRHDDGPPE